MRFVVLGLSHQTAPIELRERFAQNTTELEKTLKRLTGLEYVDEACVISTCNRVEFYAAGAAEPHAISRNLFDFVLGFSGLSPDDVKPHLYHHEGVEALRHLFRVASSLDSMVLGEPQILGQVKEAYRASTSHATAGNTIARAFEKAFAVAKRVRTETGIAENAVSMSFAAVELGREIFDSLEGKEVLVVGAGEMATLAAKHLQAHGVEKVRVASRTFESARTLAEEIGGTPSSLADLPMLLSEADIVISSTAAPGYVIDKKMMSKVVRNRRFRAILFVDIAVPRDVDPAVAELDNVYVYDVDDLQSVLHSNRESRLREAEAAGRLIDEEVGSFIRWAKSQQVVPVIKALREHALRIAAAESERTLANIRAADPKTAQSVGAMSQAIVNKMLHPVMTRLKQEGADGDPQQLVDTLVSLFSLNLEAVSDGQNAKPNTGEPAEPDNVVRFPQKEQG